MATRDTYEKQTWENLPSEETPISAERLAHIEDGVKKAMDNRALKEIYDDYSINLGRKSGTENGRFSVTFGQRNDASGYCSQSGGIDNVSSGLRSSTEGYGNEAGGDDSHAEGSGNSILGSYDHGEGYENKTSNSSYASHIEGGSNVIDGSSYAHLEGNRNKTTGGLYIHLEGAGNEMLNPKSSSVHIEGSYNKSRGSDSHNEGGNNVLAGNYSHLEGYDNTEQEGSSINHIEGNHNTAGGQYNHVEGSGNTANGYYNHVGGNGNTANGNGIHVFGLKNNGVNQYQTVFGKYNLTDGYAALIIGGGTSDSDRKNICTLDWQGNAYFLGDVRNGAGVSLNSLKSAIDMVASVAEGASSIAKVFDTKSDLDEWLATEGNPETLKVGQNIYIKDTGTPDYWWDGTGLQILETDKVEIESMTYDETMAVLNATNTEVA